MDADEDQTQEMVDLARRNAIKSGHTNTEFVLGQIEDMPLPDSSTDCVISNCVLNLVRLLSAPGSLVIFAKFCRS